MQLRLTPLLWSLLALISVTVGTIPRLAAADPDFERVIAPLLAARCLECHTGSQAKGSLDLSTLAGTVKGGESGAAILSGKPDDSVLWKRVRDD